MLPRARAVVCGLVARLLAGRLRALRKGRTAIHGLLVGEFKRCLVGVPAGEPIGRAALVGKLRMLAKRVASR